MKWAVLAGTLALIGFALYATVRRFRRGSGCCETGERVKAVPVADRNIAHYPYQVEIELGGMSCATCAVRVANALNRLDGVYARVSFEGKKALIRTKTSLDERTIRTAVREAGYTVMALHRTER